MNMTLQNPISWPYYGLGLADRHRSTIIWQVMTGVQCDSLFYRILLPWHDHGYGTIFVICVLTQILYIHYSELMSWERDNSNIRVALSLFMDVMVAILLRGRDKFLFSSFVCRVYTITISHMLLR